MSQLAITTSNKKGGIPVQCPHDGAPMKICNWKRGQTEKNMDNSKDGER